MGFDGGLGLGNEGEGVRCVWGGEGGGHAVWVKGLEWAREVRPEPVRQHCASLSGTGSWRVHSQRA